MPDDKLYPLASPEAAKMLGIQNDASLELPEDEHTPAEGSHKPEVPVYDEHESGHGVAAQPSMLGKAAKTVIPYVVVFAVGVFLYFFFFTKVDFGSLFPAKNQTSQNVQNTALLALEKQNSSAYNTWIQSFYYDVSDPSILDPNADNSGNGLTNFQKYLLNLNPKSFDTLGLGRPDSEDLAMGINPLSGLPLTANQKQILSQYFDMETIMNKLALDQMNNSSSTAPQVAGAQVFATSTSASYGNLIPADPNVVNANDLDINTNVPGRLQIPSLKVDAPLIFSSSTEDFDTDLLNGVIHYPGTALPGQIGTTYISGHSSNYPWIKSNFNHIFTYLGNLEVNQSFDIIVTLNSGKQATLHYVVTGSQQYQPNDQAQFANSGKSIVALSTCWPVGSTAKRLVVIGELTQVEQ